jgi:hypothetical protein
MGLEVMEILEGWVSTSFFTFYLGFCFQQKGWRTLTTGDKLPYPIFWGAVFNQKRGGLCFMPLHNGFGGVKCSSSSGKNKT